MITIANTKMVAIGEAMVELAPVDDGLFRRNFAGDTFNTVWHMAKLLGPRADLGFVSGLGCDAISDAFAAELAADGLNPAGLMRDSTRTMGLYLIELDGVERSFHYWRSQSAARHLANDAAALSAAIDGAGLIHLSGITLAILAPEARSRLFAVLQSARAAGSVIAFDPNIRPRLWSSTQEIRDTVQQMLILTDIALPSFDDEAAHFLDADPAATVSRLARAGVREIVVKNGSAAVHFRTPETQGAVPTPPVANIRDTTGAGDAFNAGYLAGRMRGLGAEQAIALGQRVAAEVLQHYGARVPKEVGARLSGMVV